MSEGKKEKPLAEDYDPMGNPFTDGKRTHPSELERDLPKPPEEVEGSTEFLGVVGIGLVLLIVFLAKEMRSPQTA